MLRASRSSPPPRSASRSAGPRRWSTPPATPWSAVTEAAWSASIRVERSPPGRYLRSRRKFDSAGILVGNVLYIGSEDLTCWPSIRAASGACRLEPRGGTGPRRRIRQYLACPGGRRLLVVAVRDEALVAFGPGGAVAWQAAMPGQLLGSPVIDRHGHIYVGVCQARGAGSRARLSRVRRRQFAPHPLGNRPAAPVESTPVIGDDDVLYFGDNSGTIHAVDLQGKCSGRPSRVPVRSAGTISPPTASPSDSTMTPSWCWNARPRAWPPEAGRRSAARSASRAWRRDAHGRADTRQRGAGPRLCKPLSLRDASSGG